MRFTKFGIAIALAVLFVSQLMAQEPETKAEQCEMYGSHEVSEGIWEACEYIEPVTQDDEGGDPEDD